MQMISLKKDRKLSGLFYMLCIIPLLKRAASVKMATSSFDHHVPGHHGSVVQTIICIAVPVYPACLHPTGAIKEIPLTVDLFPVIGGVGSVRMTIPPSAGTILSLNPSSR